MKEIQESTPDRNGSDEWLWKVDESKKYTVKSAYKRFYNGNRMDDNDQFVKLWKCRTLPSAQHFA